MNIQKAVIMNKSTDDKNNPGLIRVRKAVSDAAMALLDAINDLENAVASDSYQRGRDDGIAWVNEEFKRVTRSDEPEPVPTRPYVMTEVDRIMNESIISYITDSPGLRTIDITNKIIVLPVKPSLTEKSIRLAINRLKNTKKIEEKAGRWYMTGGKGPSRDYQVMRYLPDGSKYLGADVIKGQ